MAKLLSVCLLALSLGAAGCMRLSARSAPTTPPLDVPAPPPRVVETAATTDAPPPGTLIDAPAGGAPSSRRPASRPEPPKPEPQKPEPPPVAELPPAPPEPARTPPVTTLQTTPPEREAELEAVIRDMLQRASTNLNRVDYRRLNADAKAQYDQAKRFATQAEDALKAKNLVFAVNLADKAANIAVQLAGR